MTENENKISSIFSNELQSKGWNIDKLSEETGIPERFINLIMEDRVEELPASPYAHGYVVRIADVLDLDGEELWSKYFKDEKRIKSSGEQDKLPGNRFAIPRISRKILVLVALLVLVGGYFGMRVLFFSDISRDLTLNNLEEETKVVSSSEFEIAGNVDPRYQLTINEAQVYPDKSGNFERTIELDPGLNTIVFDLRGLLGKEGEIVRQIFYEAPNQENQPQENNNQTQTLNTQNFQSNN